MTLSFKKSDVCDLQNKLEKSLKGEKRLEEDEIANFVLNKYKWEDVIKKTEDLYRRLI